MRAEYEEILHIFLYSVQIRENTDQKNAEYGLFSRSVNFIYQMLVIQIRIKQFLVILFIIKIFIVSISWNMRKFPFLKYKEFFRGFRFPK